MTMTRPVYRILVEGQKHFSCEPLRASISTAACASRWRAAEPRQTCYFCLTGRQHFRDHHPDEAAPARYENEGCCLRCGRSDLRIIKTAGCCVACMNRWYEWVKQRNAKGKVPSEYLPPHDIEIAIAIQHADGRVERRLVHALHGAEALGRVLRILPDGARVVCAPRAGRATWNSGAKQFELACNECGALGLLERVDRDGRLHHHCQQCGGTSEGRGWRVAPARQQVASMHPATLADWMNRDQTYAIEVAQAKLFLYGQWIATPYLCSACHEGQLEAKMPAPGGRWSARCSACGAASAEGAA